MSLFALKNKHLFLPVEKDPIFEGSKKIFGGKRVDILNLRFFKLEKLKGVCLKSEKIVFD